MPPEKCAKLKTFCLSLNLNIYCGYQKTVSLRRFFLAHKTHGKTDEQANNDNCCLTGRLFLFSLTCVLMSLALSAMNWFVK